jgi:hypothetical protein
MTAHALNVVNRLLPNATDHSGNQRRTGGASRSRMLSPKWLTYLADRAIDRNNERQPNGATSLDAR